MVQLRVEYSIRKLLQHKDLHPAFLTQSPSRVSNEVSYIWLCILDPKIEIRLGVEDKHIDSPTRRAFFTDTGVTNDYKHSTLRECSNL